MRTINRGMARFFPALIMLGLWGNGCTKGKGSDDDGGDQTEACTDRACFSQCKRSEWTGLESYYILHAWCVDEQQCSCEARCDDALCDTYCQGDAGFRGGACAWGTCACFGNDVSDSGSSDSDGGYSDAGR